MTGHYPGWNGPAGFKNVVLNSASYTPIVEANSKRIALIISVPTTLEIAVAFGPEDVASFIGVILENLGQPIVLSRALHGGLVTRGWWGLSTAATSNIGVMEAFED